jgi:hypothetical protein
MMPLFPRMSPASPAADPASKGFKGRLEFLAIRTPVHLNKRTTRDKVPRKAVIIRVIQTI